MVIVDNSIAPAFFFKDFQLVVKSFSILISDGAQFAAPATIQTFADGDQAALQIAASKLIDISCNSTSSLHLSKDCNIFCEVVKATMAK